MLSLDTIIEREIKGMWKYYLGNNDWSGPFEAGEIAKLVVQGAIPANTYVCQEGLQEVVSLDKSPIAVLLAQQETSSPANSRAKGSGYIKEVGPRLGIITDDNARRYLFTVAEVPNNPTQELIAGALVEFDLQTDETGKTMANNVMVKGGLAEGFSGPAKNTDRTPRFNRAEEARAVGTSVVPSKPGLFSSARQSSSVGHRRLSRPTLREYTFIPDFCQTIADLAAKALDETWYFGTTKPTDFQYPILGNYLNNTFLRLWDEKKVKESPNKQYSAFNTGLVNDLYQPIYALLGKRADDGREPWYLSEFCIAGEGRAGDVLARNFNPLPDPAYYFEKPERLFYNVLADPPSLGLSHIVKDNMERLPLEFIQRHCPKGFNPRDPRSLLPWERTTYKTQFADALEADVTTHREIERRISAAVEVAIRRTRWNFKTAIPMYYFKERRIDLLLPLAVVTDDKIDLALVVERTDVGSYIGQTILPLDWAYTKARLVCRPDSDWLTTKEIQASPETSSVDSPSDELPDDDFTSISSSVA